MNILTYINEEIGSKMSVIMNTILLYTSPPSHFICRQTFTGELLPPQRALMSSLLVNRELNYLHQVISRFGSAQLNVTLHFYKVFMIQIEFLFGGLYGTNAELMFL